MALTLTVTPGHVWVEGDVISISALNASCTPVIDLNGSIGTLAITDGSVTTAKLANGVISADATGRAKIADGAITAAKLDPGVGLSSGVRGTRKLSLKYASGTTLTLSADEAVLRTAGGSPYWATLTSPVTINSATTGANALDTGTRAASRWYHVYIISNGSAVAGLLSTSATAPTLPSGYTYYTLVGAVYCNSGNSFDEFDQVDGRAWREESAQLIASGTGSAATWPTLDLSALIPPTARKVIGNMGIIANAARSIRVSGGASPATKSRGLATLNSTSGSASNNGWNVVREFVLELTTAQQINWSSAGDTTASTYKITITGWEF